MSDQGPELASPARSRRFLFNGISLIVGSMALGILGWVAFAFLGDALRKNPETAENIAPTALWCIEHRAWLPIAAIPPLLVGARLLWSRQTLAKGWSMFVMAFLWETALFFLILYSFIMFLAPMYQYQPL